MRRTAIGADVDALMGTWRGAASTRFGEHWAQWRDNADVVIAGLSARTDALRTAHAQAREADASAGMASGDLARRLG